MKTVKIVIIISVLLIMLMPASSLLYSDGNTSSNSRISPSIACTSPPLWLFNGSFANYTVVDNGISTYLKYSISSVSFISGTYTVTLNSSYLRNNTISGNLNSTSVFPGANSTVLSYYNSGTVPPWLNATNKKFSVSTGVILKTGLGTYITDQISYKLVQVVNSQITYINGTNNMDTYSGIFLKGNQTLHYGNTWLNITLALASTNVPLRTQATNSSPNPDVYLVFAGIIAVVAVSGMFIYSYRKKH